MRFNPPPNWPEVPDGWSPPPGWQPDPSWPQPPWGWPLWVDDNDEPTVSMSPSTAQWRMRRRAGQVPAPVPWYRRTFAVVLLLVVFFPVGVALLWMRTDWSVRRRGVVTAFVAVLVIIVAATNNPHPTPTTQLSPTTSFGTAGSSAGAGADVAASASTGSTTMDTPGSAVPGTSGPAETSAAAAVAPSAPAPAPSTYVAPPPPPPPPPPPSTHAAPPPPPQPPSLCGAPSNPYGYNFCGVGGFVTSPPGDICNYFHCIANFWNGRGYMVECNDGTYSMSGGIRGACSYHQGENQPVYSG